MKWTAQDREEFTRLAEAILWHPQFLELKKYIQHGNTTCYDHSINVAFYCFVKAKKKNRKKKKINIESLVRGALLHDLFLYDWHAKGREFRFHGFRHPRIAHGNAKKLFELNEIEENIILSHMWPLTITRFPKYRESRMVAFYDKIVSMKETLYRKRCVNEYFR